ncbi:MAG: hypothetical protein RLO37_28865 [Coleofasciculus chthonoplastes F1-TOW-03]
MTYNSPLAVAPAANPHSFCICQSRAVQVSQRENRPRQLGIGQIYLFQIHPGQIGIVCGLLGTNTDRLNLL